MDRNKSLFVVPTSFPELLEKAVLESQPLRDVSLGSKEMNRVWAATIIAAGIIGLSLELAFGFGGRNSGIGLAFGFISALVSYFSFKHGAAFLKKRRLVKEKLGVRPGFSDDIREYLYNQVEGLRQRFLGASSDYHRLHLRTEDVLKEMRGLFAEAARQRDSHPALAPMLQPRIEMLHTEIEKNEESLAMLGRFYRVIEAMIKNLKREAEDYYREISPFDTMRRADKALKQARDVRAESNEFLIKATGEFRGRVENMMTELNFLSSGVFSEVAMQFASQPELDVFSDSAKIEEAVREIRTKISA